MLNAGCLYTIEVHDETNMNDNYRKEKRLSLSAQGDMTPGSPHYFPPSGKRAGGVTRRPLRVNVDPSVLAAFRRSMETLS